MGFIPGFVIALITFPGVIVHEMAHQLFCRIFRVAVLEVCYFRLGTPSGYVIHETPRWPYQHLLIGVGPFFLNSILGALISFPAFIPIQFNAVSALDVVLVWLGVSIAMHAFPSTGDAASIWHTIWSKEATLATRVIGTPLVALIWLGAIGSFFWLDAIYGVVIGMALPYLLVQWLA